MLFGVQEFWVGSLVLFVRLSRFGCAFWFLTNDAILRALVMHSFSCSWGLLCFGMRFKGGGCLQNLKVNGRCFAFCFTSRKEAHNFQQLCARTPSALVPPPHAKKSKKYCPSRTNTTVYSCIHVQNQIAHRRPIIYAFNYNAWSDSQRLITTHIKMPNNYATPLSRLHDIARSSCISIAHRNCKLALYITTLSNI